MVGSCHMTSTPKVTLLQLIINNNISKLYLSSNIFHLFAIFNFFIFI